MGAPERAVDVGRAGVAPRAVPISDTVQRSQELRAAARFQRHRAQLAVAAARRERVRFEQIVIERLLLLAETLD